MKPGSYTIKRKDPFARFWAKVDRRGADDCWLWRAGLATTGYGQFCLDYKNLLAHRVSYEWLVGPIPPGLTLDHLCRTPRCVNPAHLQPVSSRENVLRGVGISAVNAMKSHCVHGHPFDEANTLVTQRPDGRLRRHCRVCRYGAPAPVAGAPE